MQNETVRQTWQQYLVKADLGVWRGVQLRYCFHWKFWQPLDAIGGPIYFGRYVEYEESGR